MLPQDGSFLRAAAGMASGRKDQRNVDKWFVCLLAEWCDASLSAV